MGPANIIQAEKDGESSIDIRYRVIGFEIHLLVLHRSPESLDEDVASPAFFTSHAGLDGLLGPFSLTPVSSPFHRSF